VTPGPADDDPVHDPSRSARDWCFDVLWFVLGTLFAVRLTQSQIDSDTSTVADIVTVGVAGASCLVLWWRRRWPVHLAVALSILVCFWPAAQIPALVCLGTVAVRRPARQLVVVLLVLLAGTAIRLAYAFPGFRFSLEIQSSAASADGSNIIGSLLLAGIVVLWGLYIRARHQLVASLRERADRAESEQRLRISQARSAERTRIAREMHDVLAHRVSLISLQAGAFQVSEQRSDDQVTDFAKAIRSSAHRTLDDLREVIGVLRTEETEAPLTPQPTFTDIVGLVDESARTGMEVSLHEELGDELRHIPTQVGRTAYRVVQEGLTNARKHSPGAAVTVTLEADRRTGLLVEISNARSPAAELSSIPGAGQGLVGLSERAGLIGAELTHGWTTADNFRLSLRLPLSEHK
jgi:signal transduction histidine kinase